MNDKQLKGLPVITLADGQTLGRVERAYLDPAAKRIVGFAYAASGGFMQPESSPMIDASDIEALDASGLVLADAAAVRGQETIARYVDLIDLHELTGRQVFTENGKSLGRILSLSFDEDTFALTALEVDAGFFANPTPVPAGQILTIGGDVVVVGDAVVGEAGSAPADAAVGAATPRATAERLPFQEETFEIPLKRQELVVEKRVRVAEEIVISREVFERAEQVAGTVRRERVHLTERTIPDGSPAATAADTSAG